jgi:hypothetical protein
MYQVRVMLTVYRVVLPALQQLELLRRVELICNMIMDVKCITEASYLLGYNSI